MGNEVTDDKQQISNEKCLRTLGKTMKLIITKLQDKVNAATFNNLGHMREFNRFNKMEWTTNINDSIANMNKAFDEMQLLHDKCVKFNHKVSLKPCVDGCVYYEKLFHELTDRFLITYLDANQNLKPEQYGFSDYKLDRFLNYTDCIKSHFFLWGEKECDFVKYFIDKNEVQLFFNVYYPYISNFIDFYFDMDLCYLYGLCAYYCLCD